MNPSTQSESHSSSAYTSDELLKVYATGERSFSGATFTKIKLSGANLKGADFSYADFSGADLSGANLRGADLSYAVLQRADLSNANLRGAMLIGTDLQHATLTGATLTDADYDRESTRFPAGFDPEQAHLKSDRP
ncbi:MAG: pentapeptide repeat-containing protein [Leptolyngbyaceae bacterium]|nr:pentapeptide repeat-containing protein [Leptolyngbyaceae bacterium]